MGSQAVQLGAQDYLLRGHIDGHVLPRALRSIIERKATEEAFFEQKERVEVTLNSIGDAVLSTDISGNVTYLNVVAERMTGWRLEEALVGYTHPKDCQARHKLTFVVERDALTQTVGSGDGYAPGIQTLDGAPPALGACQALGGCRLSMAPSLF